MISVLPLVLTARIMKQGKELENPGVSTCRLGQAKAILKNAFPMGEPVEALWVQFVLGQDSFNDGL
jgi:hypothetical protein